MLYDSVFVSVFISYSIYLFCVFFILYYLYYNVVITKELCIYITFSIYDNVTSYSHIFSIERKFICNTLFIPWYNFVNYVTPKTPWCYFSLSIYLDQRNLIYNALFITSYKLIKYITLIPPWHFLSTYILTTEECYL